MSVEDVLRPLVNIVGLLAVLLTVSAGLIWLERRLLAPWQDRYGPNRIGPFGLLQVLADMLKIFTKEDWVPPFADRTVFILAPALIGDRLVVIRRRTRSARGWHRRSQHRPAVFLGHVLYGRVQRRARGLGLQ